MPTRNVTLAISREAHLKARIWAAHYDVSLSAIIATLLEGLPGNPNAARAAERIHQQRNHPTPSPPVKLRRLPTRPLNRAASAEFSATSHRFTNPVKM